MLFKEIVDGRTDGRTVAGDIEGSQKLTEHIVLRWAKKWQQQGPWSKLKTEYNYR